MAIRRALGASAAVILAVALGACGRQPDPFGHDTTPGQECIPLAGHQVVTYGFEAVRNRAAGTAVIDKMALAKRKGLHVIATWVVPSTEDLYGAQYGYPPGHMPLNGWHWDKRQKANGARVPHSRGKYDRMNLLFVVALQARVTRGSAIGVDVWYHVGSNYYHLRTETGLVLVAGSGC